MAHGAARAIRGDQVLRAQLPFAGCIADRRGDAVGVLLADYAVGFMSTKVWGNINIGLILGLLQFVSTFAITGWYVHYSNKRLDPIAKEIRDEIEGHEFDKQGNRVGGVNK